MPRGRARRAVATPSPRRQRARPGSLGGEQVEGVHAVRELFSARRRQVDELIVEKELASTRSIAEIVAFAGENGVRVRAVAREQFDSLAATAAPQGVIARAAPIEPIELGDLVAPKGVAEADAPFLVVLAEVTDPQNLGAILRSALGAGVTGLVIGRRRGATLTPSAMKAAAGAAEHMPIAAVGSIGQALEVLGRLGLWTIALASDGDSSVFELDVADRPLALVAGAEGRGLPPLVRRRCDLACRIPLYGPIESLNVSIAVGVATFVVASRRTPNEYPRDRTK